MCLAHWLINGHGRETEDKVKKQPVQPHIPSAKQRITLYLLVVERHSNHARSLGRSTLPFHWVSLLPSQFQRHSLKQCLTLPLGDVRGCYDELDRIISAGVNPIRGDCGWTSDLVGPRPGIAGGPARLGDSAGPNMITPAFNGSVLNT